LELIKELYYDARPNKSQDPKHVTWCCYIGQVFLISTMQLMFPATHQELLAQQHSNTSPGNIATHHPGTESP